MERLKHPKTILAILLAVLAGITFFQNRGKVDVKVLWLATVHTSLATALGAAFLTGLVTGALAFGFWRSKKAREAGLVRRD